MMPFKALALSWPIFTSANTSLDKTSYMAKSHTNREEKYTSATLLGLLLQKLHGKK